MKQLIVMICLLGSTAFSFAANLDGTFDCDDGGKLKLKSYDIRSYTASLRYADGSVSTLNKIIFPGESLRGTMYRDDNDSVIGKATESDNGEKVILSFTSGDRLTCIRSSAKDDASKSIVKIGKCTGTIVGQNLVLTAEHCLKATNVRLELWDSSYCNANEKALGSSASEGAKADLALLRVKCSALSGELITIGPGSDYPAIKVKSDVILPVNSSIKTYGYSRLSNNQLTYSDCSILRQDEKSYTTDCYKGFTADEIAGASGGPLIFQDQVYGVAITASDTYVRFTQLGLFNFLNSKLK